MKKIKLEIIAMSSSISQTQSYAVVLGEIDGLRRLPILIGAFEAQAIMVTLEKLKPTRPLTHDLFYNVLNAFKIYVREVLIYKLEEGIFYAKLICQKDSETIEIDSRTSDAIALAVRIKCPIYTYNHVLEIAENAFEFPGLPSVSQDENYEEPHSDSTSHNLQSKTLEELNELLEQVLEQEDYQTAIAIRDEINKRTEK